MTFSTRIIAVMAAVLICAVPVWAKAEIAPASPSAMSAVCTGGSVTATDGAVINLKPATLKFDPPEIVNGTKSGKIPNNYEKWFDPYQPWPGSGKPFTITPTYDENHHRILGSLYGAVIPESVVLTNADGSKTFEMGVDYKFLSEWAQIANINGRLGEPGSGKLEVSYKYTLQRIDLVQADASGALSVKKGISRMVCPNIPEVDAGHTAVAGVYIAPYKVDGDWVVSKSDILPIAPADPVAAINPDAVSKTLEKLRNGETVTIGIMGDSVTLGAESGPWWDEPNYYTARDKSYRGLFIYTLKQRFPNADIKVVNAFKGGSTTEYGIKIFNDVVLPAKPDLITVAFGLNDANSAIGSPAKVPAEKFGGYIVDIVRAAKKSGTEVILVTPMQPSPFMKNKMAEHIVAHVEELRKIGQIEGVGVADVYAEWMNQATRGIPPFSQLHNHINHPGTLGHQLYADVLLRFFEK